MPAKLPAPPSLTPCRLLVVTAAALTATAAGLLTFAQAASTVSVSPTSVTRGSSVTLTMEGCGSNTVQAVSNAFGRVSLAPGTTANSFSGHAIVMHNAALGRHEVTFECGTGTQHLLASFQVVAGPARGGIGGSIGHANPSAIAVGSTLVATALGAGTWAVYRRRQRRYT
ncbi:hypothetical protein ACTVZO_42050 [Streptomyces sp. IBSNAI002]|uniref:hypothetical protein n=1 Tax=Streptomyces sp. IBSNAI002 TaxID=3457500 RepID=UPI003FD408EE